jgi:hypothetical protein
MLCKIWDFPGGDYEEYPLQDSSESSVITRSTRQHIPEDCVLQYLWASNESSYQLNPNVWFLTRAKCSGTSGQACAYGILPESLYLFVQLFRASWHFEGHLITSPKRNTTADLLTYPHVIQKSIFSRLSARRWLSCRTEYRPPIYEATVSP